MLKFLNNYPLKNITTLCIGGPAKKFIAVKTQEDLMEAIKYAKDQPMPYLIIGGGSNLLVSDEGIDSLVIKNGIKGITQDNLTLTVKSGTLLQELVDFAVNKSLSGLEKMTKIPGTVGGAIYGNAGAYGQTISNHLISVTALDPHTLTIQQYNNSDCQFGYRDSIFKKNRYIILEVTFKLEKGDPKQLDMATKEVAWKRFVKYPPGLKCAGSFFKNLIAAEISPDILNKIPPEKIVYGKLPAAVLLESVGAKGQALDDIAISDRHANLFINQGKGTAKGFYDLARLYAQKVKEKFSITLEPEVQLLNLPPLT